MTTIRRARGRQAFYRAKLVLEIVHSGLRLLPRSVVSLGAAFVRNVPTRLGVGLRYVCARRLAKRCGDNIAIFAGAYIFHWEHIELGDHISIHPMCYLDGAGGIKVGSNVSIAHGSSIIAAEHDYDDLSQMIRDAPVKLLPITIGDDVWVGAGVRILGGCTIGSRVVIGAGAVVTQDIPSHSLAVGVPARVIRQI